MEVERYLVHLRSYVRGSNAITGTMHTWLTGSTCKIPFLADVFQGNHLMVGVRQHRIQ